MTRSPNTVALAALAALSVLAAGCGGTDNKGSSSAKKSPTSGTAAPLNGAKKGGTVTVVSAGEFVDLDCGKAYYQYDYMLCYSTQRPLVSYAPDDPKNLKPDLAQSLPEVSPDGKTVTVKIKQGIKFSPPVNRVVTSKDVKYGIERMFFASVPNGYAGAYYVDIEGAKTGVKAGTKIPGITTPDDQTVVFKLSKPSGGVLAGAFGLPGSAPVPEEWAKKFDAKTPSTYRVNQVATGPYMIEQDSKGRAIGFKPGKTLTVVRNPNWDPKLDRRPAPLDGFTFKTGNDPAVAVKQIYEGKGMVTGDFAPEPADVKLGLQRYKSQLNLNPNGAYRYVAMNTESKPLDDVNVRRAVLAVFDRRAMQLARGGDAAGDVATHFIPPGIPGFEEAGGLKGPDLDYLAKESGDPAVATKYMKAAGYASGKYDGTKELTMIGVNSGVGKKAAQVAQAQFEKLGFKTNLRLVTPDSVLSRFCQIPKSGYDICPNMAWQKDFADPQSILDPVFNGANIVQEGNSNVALFDDDAIDAEMEKAKSAVGESERAKAWAQVDVNLMKEAAGIPWLFDKQGNVTSGDLNAVLNQDLSNWDMNYTGFKK